MEREEREEIPWSSLVSPADEGFDRKWYGLALVAAVGVLGFVGVRFVSSGGPAEPPPVLSAPVTSSTVSTTTQAPAAMVVTESSLTASADATHVELRVSCNGGGSEFSANFDDAYVGVNMVPVELQSFSVE